MATFWRMPGFLLIALIVSCGTNESSLSKVGGMRGQSHNEITVLLHTSTDTEHSEFKHRIMVCRPAAEYKQANIDILCRNAFLDPADEGPVVFSKIPYPGYKAYLMAYGKAAAFMAVMAGVIFFGGKRLSWRPSILTKVSNQKDRAADVFVKFWTSLPEFARSGLFGALALTTASAFTGAVLELVPGHNDRQAVELWDQVFSQFGSLKYSDFAQTYDPIGVLHSVAFELGVEVDESSLDWAQKPFGH